MKLAATALLFALSGAGLSAGPILSVTGGPQGSVPHILPNQTLAISFTVGKSYSDVSISADLVGNFAGMAYLTTQIGPAASTAEQIASDSFTSVGGFDVVMSDLNIGPGTYFLVLGAVEDPPAQGWATSTSPVTVADVGASASFGTYVSSTENIYAPSDSFTFQTMIDGSSTTPEFTITGTSVPDITSTLALLFVSLSGLAVVSRSFKLA